MITHNYRNDPAKRLLDLCQKFRQEGDAGLINPIGMEAQYQSDYIYLAIKLAEYFHMVYENFNIRHECEDTVPCPLCTLVEEVEPLMTRFVLAKKIGVVLPPDEPDDGKPMPDDWT